jgi:hypothetical protein
VITGGHGEGRRIRGEVEDVLGAVSKIGRDLIDLDAGGVTIGGCAH